VFVCPHVPEDQCACRKPKTGLLDEFMRTNPVDLEHSWVIGDRETDVQLAQNLKIRSARLTRDEKSAANIVRDSFNELCDAIVRAERSTRVVRSTKETSISVEVALDGTGRGTIQTGLGFFDHMLEQIAKHSGIDCTIDVKGDLRVDEHHTVEDTGIALGEAIRQALGDKRGIGRYGFVLPMDESLAQVALDLGGRPYCAVDAKFTRERVGELPTELVEDFFRAFADGLRANLHITVNGRNDHHKIEAMFKATARALRQAVAMDGRSEEVVPSTKGIL
jgi:imidazoleglycerol-phosphate dehydratase/histidinol-phosphatase